MQWKVFFHFHRILRNVKRWRRPHQLDRKLMNVVADKRRLLSSSNTGTQRVHWIVNGRRGSWETGQVPPFCRSGKSSWRSCKSDTLGSPWKCLASTNLWAFMLMPLKVRYWAAILWAICVIVTDNTHTQGRRHRDWTTNHFPDLFLPRTGQIPAENWFVTKSVDTWRPKTFYQQNVWTFLLADSRWIFRHLSTISGHPVSVKIVPQSTKNGPRAP